jgi:hypothetical protein
MLVHTCRCIFFFVFIGFNYKKKMISKTIWKCIWKIRNEKGKENVLFSLLWPEGLLSLLCIWPTRRHHPAAQQAQLPFSCRDGVSKNQPVKSTWSLRGSRGSNTLARVLQRGLVGSGDSSIPRQNIAVFLTPTFKHLLSCITFIACLLS